MVVDLGQWCDKKSHVKVTKAIYYWMGTGQIPQGDLGVNYIVANMVHPVQKLRNKGMRGTIWNEHDNKAVAVQHMIDFQTAEFHKYHPEYRWPKDFVLDMYRQGKITAQKITYREALPRMDRDAEAATLTTMDQGRDQTGSATRRRSSSGPASSRGSRAPSSSASRRLRP